MATVTVLETTRTYTALGIRFWDQLTDAQIRDGLDVTAHQIDATTRRSTAFRTPSGVYAFRVLPGLRDVELSDADDPELVSPHDVRSYVIEARDPQGRFVAAATRVDLPFAERGVYPLPSSESSPDPPPPGFYLFARVTRPLPPGTAVMRAQLVEAFTETPAAHAVLEVDVDGTTYFGVADEQGAVVVPFPYPQFTTTLEGSPPSGDTPIHAQTWELDLRVRYEPGDLLEPLPGSTLPDVLNIFDQGHGAFVASAEASPVAISEPLTVTLQYGQERVLRTEGRSSLWIEPHIPSP